MPSKSKYLSHARLQHRSVKLAVISNHKQKFLTKPWLTAGLRKSIRIKNPLFYTSDWDKYKLYRNKIISLTRLSTVKRATIKVSLISTYVICAKLGKELTNQL